MIQSASPKQPPEDGCASRAVRGRQGRLHTIKQFLTKCPSTTESTLPNRPAPRVHADSNPRARKSWDEGVAVQTDKLLRKIQAMFAKLTWNLTLNNIFELSIVPGVAHSRICFIIRWIKPRNARVGFIQIDFLNVFNVRAITLFIK